MLEDSGYCGAARISQGNAALHLALNSEDSELFVSSRNHRGTSYFFHNHCRRTEVCGMRAAKRRVVANFTPSSDPTRQSQISATSRALGRPLRFHS
jgi:hypothetical protein